MTIMNIINNDNDTEIIDEYNPMFLPTISNVIINLPSVFTAKPLDICKSSN